MTRFNTALRRLGLGTRLPVLEIIVPVGISFFTFQAITYVVDIYRGKIKPASLLDFAVYLAFFPHLVAGPIVRAAEFIPQLRRPQAVDRQQASRAAWLIGLGLFKKVVIASNVATAIVDPVFALPGQHSAPEIAAGDLRLRRADLRRLQRLHRHGHRHRPAASASPSRRTSTARTPPPRCRSSGGAGT